MEWRILIMYINQQQTQQTRNRVDFHIHTTLSDGLNSPTEIIRSAYDSGMAAIGISDHNLFSLTECMQVGDGEQKMIVHPECEFSTSYFVPERGKNIEVHVIGFWEKKVVPEAFKDILHKSRQGKIEYIKTIVNQLQQLEIPICFEEVLKQCHKTSHLTRHTICKVIIEKGYAKTIDEAMDRFVGNWSPYYINPLEYISYSSIFEVVQRICETNGLPILCHPFGYNLTKDEIETLIETFTKISHGIGGIELYYEKYLNNPDFMKFLDRMSSKYNLFPSVASDKHRPDQPFATGADISCYKEMLRILHTTT